MSIPQRVHGCINLSCYSSLILKRHFKEFSSDCLPFHFQENGRDRLIKLIQVDLTVSHFDKIDSHYLMSIQRYHYVCQPGYNACQTQVKIKSIQCQRSRYIPAVLSTYIKLTTRALSKPWRNYLSFEHSDTFKSANHDVSKSLKVCFLSLPMSSSLQRGTRV